MDVNKEYYQKKLQMLERYKIDLRRILSIVFGFVLIYKKILKDRNMN